MSPFRFSNVNFIHFDCLYTGRKNEKERTIMVDKLTELRGVVERSWVDYGGDSGSIFKTNIENVSQA